MNAFQELFLPRRLRTFSRTTLHNPSRNASVHVALGYSSRRPEQKATEPVIARSKGARFFQSRKKVTLFCSKCKISFGCLEFWSIEPTVGVEIGISASVAMGFSLWDCWMSVSLERSSLIQRDWHQNLMFQWCYGVSGWIWLLTKTSSLTEMCCFISFQGLCTSKTIFSASTPATFRSPALSVTPWPPLTEG